MYNFTPFQFTANKADIIYFQLIASNNTAKSSQHVGGFRSLMFIKLWESFINHRFVCSLAVYAVQEEAHVGYCLCDNCIQN